MKGQFEKGDVVKRGTRLHSCLCSSRQVALERSPPSPGLGWTGTPEAVHRDVIESQRYVLRKLVREIIYVYAGAQRRGVPHLLDRRQYGAGNPDPAVGPLSGGGDL